MPEKITKEEAKVEQAIRALRKAKELLIKPDIDVIEYDGIGDDVKVKTPKAEKADKITNETQDKEGYGLAGESFGKAIPNDGVEQLNSSIRELMQKVNGMDSATKEDLKTIHHDLEKLKGLIRRYDKMDSFVG